MNKLWTIMHPALNVAIAAARQAAEVIQRHTDRLDRIWVKEKDHHDFFSEVDVKAEQVIMKTLSRSFPDHGFIAEESGLKDEKSEHVWIIDPLDGTSNFLHGLPYVCVSIALRSKNKLECGVVFDPFHQEFFIAARGKGARMNDQRIRVSTRNTTLKDALIGTNFSYKKTSSTQHAALFNQIADEAVGIRKMGAAALELSYLAAGRLDGFVGFNLRPWDIAAAAVIIQEAGGMLCDFDEGDQYLKQGNVLAGNPKVMKELVAKAKTV